MSSLIVVRGMDDSALRPLFEEWRAGRLWVRSVEVRHAWEPQELEINGRNALAFQRGKHKRELAALVLLIHQHGGRVVRLAFHSNSEGSTEKDLDEWAKRHDEHTPG